ncbi:sensor histidine kinase [Phenylobacterium deserti]|uniref:histidine kinase n=1 Tax=Phenylobacterium deserti TaxID=1914756 RepID=A0A328A919_9CAUL|nr:DUF4118 domain-containing protein [Phenylobacterium deserti]RAK50817.1 hypothetical protein DJ018_16730 [Phenylobacterium deserti]
MSLDIDPPLQERRPLPAWVRLGVSLLLVALALGLALLFERQVRPPNLSLVFVLPVVLAAVSFGWSAALAAAAAGVLAYNFFLIEPRYTLAVDGRDNVWALLLLLAVGAIVSAVAAESRRRALVAQRAADQALTLQALARALVGAGDRSQIGELCAEALSRLFSAPAVVLASEDGELAVIGSSAPTQLNAADSEAAAWALASRKACRAQTYPADGASFDFWPAAAPGRAVAVIGLKAAERPADAEPLVEVVAGYVAVALAREDLMRRSVALEIQRASERLKADLLAAVSHDLKTPLSTILFTLQSLQRFQGEHDAQAQLDLLALAEAETARLSQLVANLLDMNRLDAEAVTVRAEPVFASELVMTALQRSQAALKDHQVRNEVGGRHPRLEADPHLTETALANLLENAAKYSPPGSTICLRSGADGGTGWIEVADEGPGFGGLSEPLFGRFVRGVQGDGRPPGTGLGLSIARGFAEAQGGTVEASDRPDRQGAVVRLVLPLAAAEAVA